MTKKFNGKPITNAAVVFNPSKDGKDLGNLEVKTDPGWQGGHRHHSYRQHGSCAGDCQTDSATYGQDFLIDQPTKEIAVTMLRPQAQVSAYEDNPGKPSDRKPGVQEPVRPKPALRLRRVLTDYSAPQL